MNIKTKLLSVFTLLVICLSFNLKADEHADSLAFLQQKWAEANYQIQNEKQKAQAFEDLLKAADKAVESYPKSADILIWRGIIKSTFAGVKGGLGALSYVKSSRADLEQALEIDPTALDGSAYTSLGTLYFKVPGWPISFGDDDEAEKLLKTALAINPEGIDPNFFYAQFLMDQGDYKGAKLHLLTASNAKPRAGREVADQGRKLEISNLLKEVDAKLL
jgi:tetratricopeptide (TPR) repeat protein